MKNFLIFLAFLHVSFCVLACTKDLGLAGGDFCSSEEFPISDHHDETTYLVRTVSCGLKDTGGYVVTWYSRVIEPSSMFSFEIYYQVYDASYNPIGETALVNTETAMEQSFSHVVCLKGGGFVIVWNDKSKVVDPDQAILGQIFESSGAKKGNPFLVNTITSGSQLQPYAATNGDGFIVVFVHSTTKFRVRGQRFNAEGVKIGLPFLLYLLDGQSMTTPVVKSFSDGSFVTAFSTTTPNTPPYHGNEVVVQLFNADGTRNGINMFVSNRTLTQKNPNLYVDENDNFLVTWEDCDNSYANRRIFGQFYDKNGNHVGEELLLNQNSTGEHYAYNIAFAPIKGGFIMILQHSDEVKQSPERGYVIYGQRFTTSGEKIGDYFQISDSIPYRFNQKWASVAELHHPSDTLIIDRLELLVTWTNYGYDNGTATSFRGKIISEKIDPIVNWTNFYRDMIIIVFASGGGLILMFGLFAALAVCQYILIKWLFSLKKKKNNVNIEVSPVEENKGNESLDNTKVEEIEKEGKENVEKDNKDKEETLKEKELETVEISHSSDKVEEKIDENLKQVKDEKTTVEKIE